jgi:hypothetical protein
VIDDLPDCDEVGCNGEGESCNHPTSPGPGEDPYACLCNVPPF